MLLHCIGAPYWTPNPIQLNSTTIIMVMRTVHDDKRKSGNRRENPDTCLVLPGACVLSLLIKQEAQVMGPVTAGPLGPSSSARSAASATPRSSSGLGLVAQSWAWESRRHSLDFSPATLARVSDTHWPEGPRSICLGFLLRRLWQRESRWLIHSWEQVPKRRKKAHKRKHFPQSLLLLNKLSTRSMGPFRVARWMPSPGPRRPSRACLPHHTQAASLWPQSPACLLASPQSTELPSPVSSSPPLRF